MSAYERCTICPGRAVRRLFPPLARHTVVAVACQGVEERECGGFSHYSVRDLARLLLALALVYTWVLLWGAYVIASGQQNLVDNVRKPTLSLLQTGLRFVLQLWHRGQLVRFRWHLSMLAEANN